MTRAYIRHISVAVVLAAAIAAHWFADPATSELQPLSYVVGLTAALAWVAVSGPSQAPQRPDSEGDYVP